MCVRTARGSAFGLASAPMHEGSFLILDDHATLFAAELENTVPDDCVLVRASSEWHRFADDSTILKHTADLLPMPRGRDLPALWRAAVDGFVGATELQFVRQADDDEHHRAIFVRDEICLRVWPARSVLIDSLRDVLRVDWQRSSNEREAARIGADVRGWIDDFPMPPRSIEHETFVGVGETIPGGSRLAATFPARPILAQLLPQAGYRATGEGKYEQRLTHEHGELNASVEIRGENAFLVVEY